MDLERFQIPANMRAELPRPTPAVPEHRDGETFLRGPVPSRWLVEAFRSGEPGFRVALGVWYLTRRYGRPAIKSVPELTAVLGVSASTVERGLRAVRGRLVEGTNAGRKTAWSIRQVPGDRVDGRSLRGPVPWEGWWAVASRLPNPALRVGAVCWIRAGRVRSAEFVVNSGEWSDHDLSRFAIGRGLMSLEAAGLVSVEPQPGRAPAVTLREWGTGPSGETSEA